MRRIMLIVAGCALALAGVGFAGVAGASPADCFDERLCGDLGAVHFCPDSGEMVGAFDACPSLVTGPYAPGGLQPNEGLSPSY